MPGIDRTTIISGPALVTYGGQSFWSKGDVILKPVIKRFPIPTAHFGKVDERPSDKRIEVTFEPSGRFTAELAAVLWPYASTVPGASVFGASDSPLVVHGRDGLKITVHNAALTQMPNIRMGVSVTTVGSLKFTGLLANNTDPTNAAAYYTSASASYPGDNGFLVSEIFTRGVQATWGSAAPWDVFSAEAGVEIAFNLQLAEQMVDGLGTVDMTFQELDVSAKLIPVGPTAAQVLAAMNTSGALGASMGGGDNLLLYALGTPAGAPRVEISSAALVDADIGYGNQRKRIGSCEWIATREIGIGGTPDPLFAIGEEGAI